MHPNDTTTKNLPKLRFPDFHGEWTLRKLGNIAQFSKGANISKEDIDPQGKIAAIRYGELYTTYGEVINEIRSKVNLDPTTLVLSKKNDVIIPASGETHIDIATASCVQRDNVALSGDINIIRSNNDGVFLAYYLNNAKKKDIAKLAQGVSVVHLYGTNLKDLVLNLPNIEEQKKIAAFLSKIDEKIIITRKKVELLKKFKKGAAQAIFSRKFRFKDVNGNPYADWHEKKLGNVTTLFSSRNKSLVDAPVYSVTNSKGFVLQTDHFSKVVAGDDLKDYKVVIKNDFAYNPARINVGSIARFKNKRGVISSLYVCFRPTEELDATFLEYFLQLDSTRYYFNTFGEGGVRIYLWYPLFSMIGLMLPSIEEQQKIANFLVALDDKIKLEESKLEQAKNFKKALLQQMFV